MKTIRYKGGQKRGDPDRYSFAFFVVGALVVIAVVFFLGFQVGRVVEKSAVKEQPPVKSQGERKADIHREMSAYSEEAVRIPVVAPPPAAPPTAGEELRTTEANATFPDSLTRKDPAPQPLVKQTAKASPESPRKGKFLLQAGAMKNRDAAEALRDRLERAGHKSKVVRVPTRNRGDLFKVRVGPHGSREEAMKAMRAIKSEMKIDVILLKE